MKSIVLAILVAVLAGCARPSLIAGADPSDPSAAVPKAQYVPLAGGADYTPVDPLPWVERNRGVAPRSRSPQ